MADDNRPDGPPPGPAIILGHLLATAAGRLAALGAPAVVAACPNKHDDAGRFPDWLGVQVGRATWERSDYGAEGGDVTEKARNPDALPAARAVLDGLQDGDWRTVVARALDLDLADEVVALIRQHGATWLVITSTLCGQDLAFLVGNGGGLTPVGVAARIDERLGDPWPLMLTRIDPTCWPQLQAAAPAFPLAKGALPEGPKAAQARTDLAALLRPAIAQLRAVPGTTRYIAAGRDQPYRCRRAILVDRRIALDGRWLDRKRYDDAVRAADPAAAPWPSGSNSSNGRSGGPCSPLASPRMVPSTVWPCWSGATRRG